MLVRLYICDRDGNCSRVNGTLIKKGGNDVLIFSDQVLEFCDAVQAADDDLQENVILREMIRYQKNGGE